MSANYKIRCSRENWKVKATARADRSRNERKTISRQSRSISKCKSRIRQLEKELSTERKRTSDPVVQNKIHLVFIALQLFTEVRISFRGVARVLSALSSLLGIRKPPCPQSVINWVSKLSLVRISAGLPPARNFVNDFSNGWMFMIDESIGRSGGKLLVILAVRLDHYSSFKKYPGLTDVRAVGVAVSVSWVGESVADFLKRVIALTGRPSAYIKDGGGNLNKACNILGDSLGSPVVQDISHVAANLLKSEYGNHPDLEGFLSTCGEASKRMKQTALASLTPPKSRVKSRFLNLHTPVNWAEKILDLSPQGRAPKGSILQKLRDSLEALPQYRPFIKRFLRDARPLLECQNILKTQGLTITSGVKCRETIKHLPNGSTIKTRMHSWLDSHLVIAKKLGVQDIGLITSTDSLESLFGVVKSHGTGEIKDPNRMGLRLPSICGKVTMDEARQVVSMPHEKLIKVQKELPSLQADRRKIFSGQKGLEELANISSNLELIPESKNRDNLQITGLLSSGYIDTAGPQNSCLTLDVGPPKPM